MLNPIVQCEGVDLARLEKGQFFTVTVDEGDSRCWLIGSVASNEVLRIKVVAGGAYFVRYEGGRVGQSQKLGFVTRSVAGDDFKRLKAIEADAIKSPSVT